MINVFIGYDSREAIAFEVLAWSIRRRSSLPVSITAIRLDQLPGFNRPRDPLQSTEFSFSRFLVPWLCDYQGWGIFMDCDMLCMDDIAKLWNQRKPAYAVQLVKHDHKPLEETKFLGQIQTQYPKKNWSSLMLFNNEECRHLTLDYVNNAGGLDLHQFKWLADDELIGKLPPRWNHLVDYDAPIDNPAMLHYTQGGPWFSEYRDCGYSAVWHIENEFRMDAK